MVEDLVEGGPREVLAMAKRVSEIAVQFKDVPPILFNSDPSRPIRPNVLTLRIQPDEGFSLRMSSKKPGPRVEVDPVEMDFQYVAEFASGAAMTTALPAGYRGIVTHLAIDYFKKARGKVTAESRPALPDLSVEGEHDFYSTLTDATGDLVARATVRWKLGPIPPKTTR